MIRPRSDCTRSAAVSQIALAKSATLCQEDKMRSHMERSLCCLFICPPQLGLFCESFCCVRVSLLSLVSRTHSGSSCVYRVLGLDIALTTMVMMTTTTIDRHDHHNNRMRRRQKIATTTFLIPACVLHWQTSFAESVHGAWTPGLKCLSGQPAPI